MCIATGGQYTLPVIAEQIVHVRIIQLAKGYFTTRCILKNVLYIVSETCKGIGIKWILR